MSSGTNMLILEYNYHNNNSENIGLGNVYIESDNGLNILNTTCIYCNMDCGIHYNSKDLYKISTIITVNIIAFGGCLRCVLM